MSNAPEQNLSDANGSYYWPLFEHLSTEHNLNLLDSELDEIIQTVRKMDSTIYQIQTTEGKWSDLRPEEVEVYLNSNADVRVKPEMEPAIRKAKTANTTLDSFKEAVAIKYGYTCFAEVKNKYRAGTLHVSDLIAIVDEANRNFTDAAQQQYQQDLINKLDQCFEDFYKSGMTNTAAKVKEAVIKLILHK